MGRSIRVFCHVFRCSFLDWKSSCLVMMSLLYTSRDRVKSFRLMFVGEKLCGKVSTCNCIFYY